MKKLLATTVLFLLLGMGNLLGNTKYENIDPYTLPVYIGCISDPLIKVVYEDSTGKYILVIVDGVIKVYYL
ncbi:MAG: hypothetical protein Q8M98_01245 [Candidatus Cloacimonadaceae bacterium]|nr:hypothetical protein [Candidatus Cloacimonadaceae bacterium]MDP3113376.1 hypothetical protein [Candidatus Cloacimonadaceae bacterium]